MPWRWSRLPVHVQQVINGSKVTDHHALLPTKSMLQADPWTHSLPGSGISCGSLPARLLCAVGKPYRYAETLLTTICAGEEFTAKGKVVLEEGWKAVERKVLGELLASRKNRLFCPMRRSRASAALPMPN